MVPDRGSCKVLDDGEIDHGVIQMTIETPDPTVVQLHLNGKLNSRHDNQDTQDCQTDTALGFVFSHFLS